MTISRTNLHLLNLTNGSMLEQGCSVCTVMSISLFLKEEETTSTKQHHRAAQKQVGLQLETLGCIYNQT